jgi:IS5 family transposase
LLALGPDVDPPAAVADKGYASKANRKAARVRGIIPVIPHKANEKNKPGFFAKAIYRGRARIEQAVGKLKRFKRVALRCERRSGTSHPSSLSQPRSSWSNPSTQPSSWRKRIVTACIRSIVEPTGLLIAAGRIGSDKAIKEASTSGEKTKLIEFGIDRLRSRGGPGP